jgi:hypothetical protein
MRGASDTGDRPRMPAALRLQEPLTLGLRLCFSMTSDRHDASPNGGEGEGR